MTSIKTTFGVLVAVVAAVVGVAFGAVQASASSAPIVIAYEKTCEGTHCAGTTADGVSITMDVNGVGTGKAAQLTLTERITLRSGAWFDAEMSGHASPAGFIVLNGTVTASSNGSCVGAQVHQRSNFVGLVDGDPSKTKWTGELRIMPASA
jgi:hypothetical protein